MMCELEIEWFPDGWIVTQDHPFHFPLALGFAGLINDHPMLVEHGCAHFGAMPVMGFSGEGASPGNVAVAGGVVNVAAFAENPSRASMGFAEGKVVRSDVQLASGETLFGDGELVHEGEAQLALFGAEIHGQEAALKP